MRPMISFSDAAEFVELLCCVCCKPVSDANRSRKLAPDLAELLAARGESLCDRPWCRGGLASMVREGEGLITPAEVASRAAAIRAANLAAAAPRKTGRPRWQSGERRVESGEPD